jgi:hypothetical protein
MFKEERKKEKGKEKEKKKKKREKFTVGRVHISEKGSVKCVA